jgi:hypothetical protein
LVVLVPTWVKRELYRRTEEEGIGKIEVRGVEEVVSRLLHESLS